MFVSYYEISHLFQWKPNTNLIYLYQHHQMTHMTMIGVYALVGVVVLTNARNSIGTCSDTAFICQAVLLLSEEGCVGVLKCVMCIQRTHNGSTLG